MSNASSPNRILVIKLSAFGDFIQALGPMAAIRAHHPDAHITLMTTHTFADLAKKSPYFDAVLIDERPKFKNINGWMRLRRSLLAGQFDRVYDLQNNDRTALYLKLFGRKKPEWVGAAKGASHRNISKERTAGHALEGHRQTLKLAGINTVEIDKLEWLDGSIDHFNIGTEYVLLVPGCAPSHPEKRWPADKYARLARMLVSLGFLPVILGTQAESEAADIIKRDCPEALSLINQTDFTQITALARHAAGAIGNDTGPMHLIAATGCSCLVLFSKASNPIRHAPQGGNVKIIQKDDLNELKSEDVIQAFSPDQNVPEQKATRH